LFYQPLRETINEPAEYGFNYTPILFHAADGTRLVGWFFPARLKPGEKIKGTFVQFHGNGENRTTHFGSLIWAIDEGYNLFTFDYRGYSGSSGIPSQEGLNLDALAAIRWVDENVPKLEHPDLVLYGQSLGGAVLARAYETVFDRSRVAAIVIDSSFYSYHVIAQDMLSRFWLSWPFQWLGDILVSNAYSPELSFAAISPTPLLVIHANHDPVIPMKFGDRIYELAKEPKEYWRVPAKIHLIALEVENGKYRKKLLEWLATPHLLSPSKTTTPQVTPQ